MKLPAEAVRQYLGYDESTGNMVWRMKAGRCAAGSIAGCAKREGRVWIQVKGTCKPRSHMVWAWKMGEWPPEGTEIDHKDRDCGNDRWGNLRLATPTQNKWNASVKHCSQTGLKGVYWHARNKRWAARIRISGNVRMYLCCYRTKARAEAAYDLAAYLYRGEFAPMTQALN